MDAALASAQKELGRSCAQLADTLRRAAEEEMASARAAIKRREEALEQREEAVALREAKVAQREKDMQANLDKAPAQVQLSPTPARSSATMPCNPPATKKDVQAEDTGLSPLPSARSEAASVKGKDSEEDGQAVASTEAARSPMASPARSTMASPAPSARANEFASPAPKPRPAIPTLRLAATKNGCKDDELKQDWKEADSTPEVGRLKAMFESKAKTSVSTPARSERRVAGACSSIAAAASALQAAASPTQESRSLDVKAAPKLSLQDLLRQDEERSAAFK